MKRSAYLLLLFAALVALNVALVGCDDNSQITGPTVVPPPPPPEAAHIVAILSPLESSGYATDFDHEVDTIVPTQFGGPVKYWELMGDKDGNDFIGGGSTLVALNYNTIRVKIWDGEKMVTISFVPNPLTNIPLEHTGPGDNDYAGHGPWEIVRSYLELSPDHRVVYMVNEVTMQETKEDGTKATLPERYHKIAIYEVAFDGQGNVVNGVAK